MKSTERKNIRKIFFRFLISVTLMTGTISFIFYGISSKWDFGITGTKFCEGLASAALSVVVSIIIIKSQFEDFFIEISSKKSGIIGYESGFNHVLKHEGGLENFLSTSYHKKIDIFGMAMMGFFEYYSIADILIQKAKDGYKVRVFFANPESQELTHQEVIENKKGKLKSDIQRLSDELISKMKENEISNKNIKVYYVNMLPRAFIIRSGGKMIVTNYLYKGPREAPSFCVRAGDDNNIYAHYLNYINESEKEANSKKILN